MKIVEKLNQPATENENVFCNLCGLSMKSPMGAYYGLVEATVTAGYESTHLEDGDVHKFSLCERCLSDIFNKCRYPTLQGNYIFDDVPQAPDFDPELYFSEKASPEEIAEFNKESLIEDLPTFYDPFDGDMDDEDLEEIPPSKKKEDLN